MRARSKARSWALHAGGKHGNKGYEAAETVLEMVDLIGRIEEERASTQ